MKRALAATLLLLAGCASAGGPGTAPDGAYDLVITNGRIVDGTGAAWYYGDIGVRGDRRERIDASGLVVAPGFIDIQSHSRGNFLDGGDGRVVSKITQGVTTEIMGEGSTNAIVNASVLDTDDTADPVVRQRLEEFGGPRGFDNWLRAMETHGAAVNVGAFLGGDNVRSYAMGMRQGAPGAAELDSMRKVVRWAMEGGALGIATALIYPPANFATTEELIEAAKTMAPYGGLYITHLRSEADKLLEAMDEAIRVGAEGGVPVEIFHLKAAGVRNFHKAALAIAKIDSARATGLDVQADMYPYTAAGTGLTACFPPWSAADGKLFDNLADAQARARMRAEIENQTEDWENFCELSTPENVLILGVAQPQNAQYAGMRLSEIAEAQGKDWIETAFDLVLSERQSISTIYFVMDEANVQLQLQQPWMKFGTDAGGRDPETARELTHPRAYGTFARILGRYVREQRVIPLEDAVRKMTSAVTTRLGIQERGVLRQGMFADITIFDPETIIDVATYEEPHQVSRGVQHVLVNGVPVVRDARVTGALPGRALRGPGYRP